MSTKLPSCTLFCRSERGVHSKKCERAQAKLLPQNTVRAGAFMVNLMNGSMVPISAGSVTFTTSVYSPDTEEEKKGVDIDILEKLKQCDPYKVERPVAAVPDYTQCITGWRGWKIRNNHLESLAKHEIWEYKNPVIAQCKALNNDNHEAPGMNCTCGIWSFKTLDNLVKALGPYSGIDAIGQVSLWGRVVECENGFRAEKAYPSELYLFDIKHEKLGYYYNVPVRTVKKGDIT